MNNKITNTEFMAPKETFEKGNIEKNIYLGYKNYIPKHPKINVSKENELLLNVMTFDFYMHELNLYLDTHPMDKEAIKLFKNAREMYNQYANEYTENYGPLEINTLKINNDYWEWLNV